MVRLCAVPNQEPRYRGRLQRSKSCQEEVYDNWRLPESIVQDKEVLTTIHQYPRLGDFVCWNLPKTFWKRLEVLRELAAETYWY